MTRISMTVDGTRYEDEVEPRLPLVHCLRDHLGFTGTPVGCDTSNCGACTVELDGDSVTSCSVLEVQADGGEVTTVQGLASDGGWTPRSHSAASRAAPPGCARPGAAMSTPDARCANSCGTLANPPGCATAPPPPSRDGSWGGRGGGAAPHPPPTTDQTDGVGLVGDDAEGLD
ncbi:(2Fe-2S)-binding protein, partial [Streptomyces atratus]|uniref:(2Fe-2S)-binding protein n=1 Tax=Streptomyces atratus TaxID=1893 RepID=UPI003654F9EC